MIQRRYIWKTMGELKVKVTYKNHLLYNKVVESPNGCYIDHYNMEIRVKYNQPYNAIEQGKLQHMDVVQVVEEIKEVAVKW